MENPPHTPTPPSLEGCRGSAARFGGGAHPAWCALVVGKCCRVAKNHKLGGIPSQPIPPLAGSASRSGAEDDEAEAAPGGTFSCKAGEFLDMKAQACKPCAEGTYSLGTGVRFDEWDEVPHGFANVATNLEVDDAPGGCSGTWSTWVPLGDYVASNTDECTATLMYAVNLKQSGTVSFEYIYPDSSIVFEFFVQNDQCQPTVEESRWMRTTEKGWDSRTLSTLPLPGVAYTSECFPCKPGTYAPAAGSSACQLCPADTFSSKGATACQPCEPPPSPLRSAEPGSASCKPRPPCTDKDYFYTHTACDASGETQLMFKWAEPKICSEELPQAAKLPPSGVKTRCPPCNPGFAKSNGSTCQPCPYGSYSNGSGCLSCPAGTEPALGLEYKWWNVLPPNMETTVLSGINFEYKGMAGWEVAGDYIYTAAGASDNDFMILTLVVPGFSPPSPVLEDAESKEVARITFVFETVCSVSCELYFMVVSGGDMGGRFGGWKKNRGGGSHHPCIPPRASTPAPTRRWRRGRAPGGSNPTPTSWRKIFSLVLPGRILHYDFSALAAGTAFASGPSFTAKGLKYFHHFNISLCGNQGRKMASCSDNVTDARLPAGEGDPARVVTSYVCQSILVPPDVMGYKVAVSSQPVSLADRLVGEPGLGGGSRVPLLLPPQTWGKPSVLAVPSCGTPQCHWATLVATRPPQLPLGHPSATGPPRLPLGHPSCHWATSVPLGHPGCHWATPVATGPSRLPLGHPGCHWATSVPLGHPGCH
uniref:Endosome-lysosome associated apoptosis and autophagy regulator 1 n=1 Tax=Strix occidentalis caurina TaxID=311401 RepID=A0A8D0F114_STROC